MQAKAIPPNPLTEFVPFSEYTGARPQFFPKRGTPSYFQKFRRKDCLARGIIISTAEGDYIHPEKADHYILDLGRNGETYRTKPTFRRKVRGSDQPPPASIPYSAATDEV